MAKSSKGKVIQMLSPENYIRQKARNLPIYECLVNSNWADSQFANLVIARQHTNGNITAGIFLVDLSCLGVKDTTWFFNVSMTHYRENIDRFMDMEDGIENIDYALAHNIIHAGLEFADDYEFKPHKDFTSITQFILEEENDDIPLIEIECGFDGLPAYMQGSLDSDPKSKQIIAQLERVAGHGNYYLIDDDGNLINDIDDFDDDDEEEDQFENMSLEEKEAEFLRQYEHLADLGPSDIKQFFQLHQSIIDDMIDSEKFDQYHDGFIYELTSSLTVDDSEIPGEMLGIESADYQPSDKIKEMFWEIIEDGIDPKKMKRKFKLFSNLKGVDAAIDYIDILIAGLNRSEQYGSKIKAAAEKYPHYALVQLEWAKLRTRDVGFVPSNDFPYSFAHYFSERESIHSWEFFCYLDMRTHYLIAEYDINKLEAWKMVILNFEYDEVDTAMLYSLISMSEIEFVVNYLKDNY